MPSLPITNIPPFIQYTALAAQTVFTFPFYLFVQGDISVFKTPVGQPANDVANILTLNVNYTVTINVDNTGGTVTLLAPATAGDIITIVRTMAATRLSFYTTGGAFTADAVNTDFESEVLMIQQLNANLNIDTPRYNLSETTVAPRDTILPRLAANQTWQMNSAGTAIIASSVVPAITQINTAGLLTGGPVVSGTANLSVLATSSAQAKAGTDNATAMTPLVTQAHPSTLKTHVSFNGTNGATYNNLFNVTVNRLGVGQYQISFVGAAITFTGTHYGVFGNCQNIGLFNAADPTTYGTLVKGNATTTVLLLFTVDGNSTPRDFTEVNVSFFGQLA